MDGNFSLKRSQESAITHIIIYPILQMPHVAVMQESDIYWLEVWRTELTVEILKQPNAAFIKAGTVVREDTDM